MADPQHVEKLDFIDVITVMLYRCGISIAVFALLIPLLEYSYPGLYYLYLPLLAMSAGLIASSLHIYNKEIRWAISFSAWLALMLFPLVWRAQQEFLMLAINGLLFVTISGIALKESFCFRIPGLKLVPVLLIVALFANWQDYEAASLISHTIAGGILLMMCVLKWRMPLHFDIGDKSRYQI